MMVIANQLLQRHIIEHAIEGPLRLDQRAPQAAARSQRTGIAAIIETFRERQIRFEIGKDLAHGDLAGFARQLHAARPAPQGAQIPHRRQPVHHLRDVMHRGVARAGDLARAIVLIRHSLWLWLAAFFALALLGTSLNGFIHA